MRGLIIDLLFSPRLLLTTLIVAIILLCSLQIATMAVVIGIRIVSRTMMSTTIALVITASVMAIIVICTVVASVGIVLLLIGASSHELLASHLAIAMLLISI